MSFGKSNSSGTQQQTTIPTLSAAQDAMINAQTGFYTGTVQPAYQQAVAGAGDVYNQNLGGVTNAAQNLAGTASAGQQVLGSTGQSALQTGIGALENVTSPAYQQQQLDAALQPAQAQYQQNLAAQNAQFGGAGQLGSARAALAGNQLAGMNQANQQTAAAGVMKDIATQQLAAGSSLASLGQAGIGGAIGAAGQQVSAAMTPQQLYNQYASVIFGTPSTSYNPNFAGTQSVTQSGAVNNAGANTGLSLKFS